MAHESGFSRMRCRTRHARLAANRGIDRTAAARSPAWRSRRFSTVRSCRNNGVGKQKKNAGPYGHALDRWRSQYFSALNPAPPPNVPRSGARIHSGRTVEPRADAVRAANAYSRRPVSAAPAEAAMTQASAPHCTRVKVSPRKTKPDKAANAGSRLVSTP